MDLSYVKEIQTYIRATMREHGKPFIRLFQHQDQPLFIFKYRLTSIVITPSYCQYIGR